MEGALTYERKLLILQPKTSRRDLLFLGFRHKMRERFHKKTEEAVYFVLNLTSDVDWYHWHEYGDENANELFFLSANGTNNVIENKNSA